MASTIRLSAVPPTCILYKLAPEIREMIFIQAAHHFFEEQPKYQQLRFHPEIQCLSWTRLLETDARPTKEDLIDDSIPDFERALLGDRNLYLECVKARLSLSTLMMWPSTPRPYETRDEGEVTYPIIGKDIPLQLLDSVRCFRYQACIMQHDNPSGNKYNTYCEMVKEALERSLKDLAIFHPKPFVLGVYAQYNVDNCKNHHGHQVEDICGEVLDLYTRPTSAHPYSFQPSLLKGCFLKWFTPLDRRLKDSERECMDFTPSARPVKRRWMKLRNREVCVSWIGCRQSWI